jgi:hypothetical protein
VADAELHGALVAGILRVFGLDAARDLDQGTAFQVALEKVAVAHQNGARVLAVIDDVRAVELRQFGVAHLAWTVLAGQVGVAQLRAGALLLEIDVFTVPAPPCLFGRVADPVRVGHRLVEADWRGRCRRWERGQRSQDGEETQSRKSHVHEVWVSNNFLARKKANAF